MEFLELVDKDNNLIGKKEERGLIHTKGLWHREIAIIIINEKWEFLVQKRAATKIQEPNMWALVAGHLDMFESPENAAVRETYEEVGLETSIADLELLCISKVKADLNKGIKNYHFKYMYFLKTNKKIDEYKIELKELSEVKYISFNEFEDVVNGKKEEYTFGGADFIKDAFKILKEKLI